MSTSVELGQQEQDTRALAAQIAQLQAAIAAAAPVEPTISKLEPETAQLAVQTVVVAESAAETANDQRLTEKEAIEIVQRWVEQDNDVEPEQRRSFEEMVKDLQYAANARDCDLKSSELVEIVKTHAPNAPVNQTKSEQTHPLELEPLITSGTALLEDGYWLAKRCMTCGQFKADCCGRSDLVSLVRDDGKTLTSFGRQAAGLDPIKPPKPPKSMEETIESRKQSWVNETWWSQFRGAGELEGTGDVKMYIENFLPEGATLICGLPKEGKSFLALSIAKALTSGKPLFGKRGYEVSEVVPVLYLAAESGDGALKLRCKKFDITQDKTLFISRTLSQGPMLGLDDPDLERLVRAMRPVVILETLIRFNDGKDEDDASENRKLAEAIFRLIAWGARAVVGIHHSRKDLNKAKPTKESAVRGSGDGLAMVDAVWLVMQDEKIFQGGKGPNEVDVVGWGRDFNPSPMRLALTKKASNLPPGVITFAPGIVSCIDSGHDFEWVDTRVVQNQRQAERQDLDQAIVQLITENPSITRKELAEGTERSEWEVRNILKRLGYHRPAGGKKGEFEWKMKPAKAAA